MKLDASLMTNTLAETPALARAIETAGFDAVWTSETQHDPFLPLVLAGEHTTRLKLGTAVAIAFARSPMTLAHTAWDLAAHSHGRFMLGLGTQVKAHIERRFSMPWPESPVGQLRDFIGALRAIWQSWQTGGRLRYESAHYRHTLMTPFFSPGPIAHPHIPIYIAGVNAGLAKFGGEACDGFHVHPFHTPDYLRQVLWPALREGADKAGRDLAAIEVSGSVFVITDEADRMLVRSQLAFYGSTPSYRAVLDFHGWGEVGDKLTALAPRQAWDEMFALVTDEMIDAFAVTAPLGELAAPLRTRYEGALHRITLYKPFMPGQNDEAWRTLTQTLQS